MILQRSGRCFDNVICFLMFLMPMYSLENYFNSLKMCILTVPFAGLMLLHVSINLSSAELKLLCCT